MANSVDPDQTAPIGAVCSGSTLFASLLNLSVMLGNYLQQTTSADDIFRCISGLIFGRFYSRYLVIFPMPKSIFFSQCLEENFQFQTKKNHHFNHGKSWLKTVEYSTLHSLI